MEDPSGAGRVLGTMAASLWGTNPSASTLGPKPLTDLCCHPHVQIQTHIYSCIFTYIEGKTTTVLFRKETFQDLGLWPEQSQLMGQGVDPYRLNPAWHGPGNEGKKERLHLFSFLVEPKGFIWDQGTFCTASSIGAGEQLMDSWIYLMNRLCSFCCFLICISSSCQPKEGEQFVSLWGEEIHKIEQFLETKTLSCDNQWKCWGTAH